MVDQETVRKVYELMSTWGGEVFHIEGVSWNRGTGVIEFENDGRVFRFTIREIKAW